jgi:hypothetical protein
VITPASTDTLTRRISACNRISSRSVIAAHPDQRVADPTGGVV